MTRDNAPLDESRLFHGPGLLSVYVPPKPPPHPDDWKRDFPPGLPPEVVFDQVKANYWLVLREGKMAYMSWTKSFNEQEMAWLHSIRDEVERVIRAR